jgi:uncharacterized protein
MSTLALLDGRYAVCQLASGSPVPAWAAGTFVSVTRTPSELSIVCEETAVPTEVKCERGWRVFEVAGPLEFSLTGVLSGIAGPLAAAGVSIFAVSTFDTDYVLVKEENLTPAVEALNRAGHHVR